MSTARTFIVDPGGRDQRFYSVFSPVLTHGDKAILKVQRFLQSHVTENTTVDEMAKIAGLGRRTFLRRFHQATSFKTTEYVQNLRVAHAREYLERTDMTQQQIAWEVGYEDSSAFQRVFVRLIGLSPREYRHRFACR